MAAAPKVQLHLPLLLEPVVGLEAMQVRGHSLLEALEDAFEQIPVLKHHLALDSGQLRPHVLCLHNGVNIARDKLPTTKLKSGDDIHIHQAISGG